MQTVLELNSDYSIIYFRFLDASEQASTFKCRCTYKHSKSVLTFSLQQVGKGTVCVCVLPKPLCNDYPSSQDPHYLPNKQDKH